MGEHIRLRRTSKMHDIDPHSVDEKRVSRSARRTMGGYCIGLLPRRCVGGRGQETPPVAYNIGTFSAPRLIFTISIQGRFFAPK